MIFDELFKIDLFSLSIDLALTTVFGTVYFIFQLFDSKWSVE